MKRAIATALSLAAVLGAGPGCSTLGTGGGTPEGLPHGGTGPYRELDNAETRLARRGASFVATDLAVERSMVGGLHLFYAAAPPLPEPDAGMPDAGTPDAGLDGGDLDAGASDAGDLDGGPDAGPPPEPTEIDWTLYEPRRIYRSPPSDVAWGYPVGSVVLEASEGWEGGYVADPWAVELPDGRARLYYAAEGGIGVAEASAIDGTFTARSAPILGTIGGAVPRCPAVVPTDGLSIAGAFYMVFELDGAIHGATSADGIAFSDEGPITVLPREAPDGAVLETLPPRDRRDGVEISRGCPGAMIAHTPAARSVLRVYYESRRDNGAHLVGMLATTDAEGFEAYGLPVFLDRDRRMPAPREVDSRITLMFHWAPRVVRMEQRGEASVGVAPGGVVLTGPTR